MWTWCGHLHRIEGVMDQNIFRDILEGPMLHTAHPLVEKIGTSNGIMTEHKPLTVYRDG